MNIKYIIIGGYLRVTEKRKMKTCRKTFLKLCFFNYSSEQFAYKILPGKEYFLVFDTFRIKYKEGTDTVKTFNEILLFCRFQNPMNTFFVISFEKNSRKIVCRF